MRYDNGFFCEACLEDKPLAELSLAKILSVTFSLNTNKVKG